MALWDMCSEPQQQIELRWGQRVEFQKFYLLTMDCGVMPIIPMTLEAEAEE